LANHGKSPLDAGASDRLRFIAELLAADRGSFVGLEGKTLLEFWPDLLFGYLPSE